jgi:stage III sporulation protein AC
MDVSLLFKIAGIGIIVSVLHTILKQAGKDEQGQAVALVGIITVLMLVVNLMVRFFSVVAKAFGNMY